MNKGFISTIIIPFIALAISLDACQNQNPEKSNEKGKQLALALCSTCHLFPEPDLLDKASWEKYILPRMGYFLGHYSDSVSRQSLIEDGPAEQRVLARDVFPELPIVDSADWNLICSYYLNEAPTALPAAPKKDITPGKLFKAIRPALRFEPPSTTFIDIDEQDKSLYLGDAFTASFYALDKQLKPYGQARTGETPVWMTHDDSQFYITVMGSFSPTDAPSGKLIALQKDGKGGIKEVLKDLQRPVHHAFGDLNNDGLEDIVVCEFAKWTGGLSWWQNMGDDTYTKHVLRNTPGATKAYLKDFNGDGLLDVIALFGQGNEGIWAMINKGNGEFEETEVLRFPPSWGSSYFSLNDIDADGDDDIIYCAGDNADFGPVIKPYHGIRIYKNDGANNFDLFQFLPLNGAYSAIPSDFDGDGDVDIAAISFFPDFNNAPQEAFVFYENDGSWNFTTTSFPEVSSGRWVVMDAGDIDQDGDLDLALAALTFEVVGRPDLVEKWSLAGIPFVILENLKK